MRHSTRTPVAPVVMALLLSSVRVHAHETGALIVGLAFWSGHFLAMLSLCMWLVFWPGSSRSRVFMGLGLFFSAPLSMLVLTLIEYACGWQGTEPLVAHQRAVFIVALVSPWVWAGWRWWHIRRRARCHMPPNSPSKNCYEV